MKITGVKSICCGTNIKQRNPYVNVKTPQEWEDKIYICLKCKQPTEAYFTAMVRG